MSYPSRVTLGRGTSTSFISVGNMSRVDASWKIQSSQIQPATSDINHAITSVVVPGLILLGQLAIPGTLCPPSHVVALPQRSRPPFPPLIPQRSAGLYITSISRTLLFYSTHPLSAVKKINVLSSTPEDLMVSNTWPTAQSSSVSASPKSPLTVVLVNFSLANWGRCVCWKARYRKNGVPDAAVECKVFHANLVKSTSLSKMHII